MKSGQKTEPWLWEREVYVPLLSSLELPLMGDAAVSMGIVGLQYTSSWQTTLTPMATLGCGWKSNEVEGGLRRPKREGGSPAKSGL